MSRYGVCAQCGRNLKERRVLTRVSECPTTGARYKWHLGDFCEWGCIARWLMRHHPYLFGDRLKPVDRVAKP